MTDEPPKPDPTGMVWSPHGMSRPVDHLTRDDMAGLRWLTSQPADESALDDRGRRIALAVMAAIPNMKPSGMALCVAAVKAFAAGLESARAHERRKADEAKVN